MAPKLKPPSEPPVHVPVSISFATPEDIQYLSDEPSPPLSPTTHSGGKAAVPSKRRPRPRTAVESTEDAFGPPRNPDDALGPRLPEDVSGPPPTDYADDEEVDAGFAAACAAAKPASTSPLFFTSPERRYVN